MKYPILIIITLLFQNCVNKTNNITVKNDNDTIKAGKVVLRGIACDDKAGAAICTDDGGLYYLDSLYRWDKKFYKKRIIVKGILYTIEELGGSGIPDVVEQTVGIYWIRNPKWELDSIQ
jgi:hypothetical protein